MSISTKKLSKGILTVSGSTISKTVSAETLSGNSIARVTISFEAVLPQDAKKAKLNNPIIYLILIPFFRFLLTFLLMLLQ